MDQLFEAGHVFRLFGDVMKNLLFGKHQVAGADNRLKHGISDLDNGKLVNAKRDIGHWIECQIAKTINFLLTLS